MIELTNEIIGFEKGKYNSLDDISDDKLKDILRNYAYPECESQCPRNLYEDTSFFKWTQDKKFIDRLRSIKIKTFYYNKDMMNGCMFIKNGLQIFIDKKFKISESYFIFGNGIKIDDILDELCYVRLDDQNYSYKLSTEVINYIKINGSFKHGWQK